MEVDEKLEIKLLHYDQHDLSVTEFLLLLDRPAMRCIEVNVWSNGNDAMRFALTMHENVYTDFTTVS